MYFKYGKVKNSKFESYPHIIVFAVANWFVFVGMSLEFIMHFKIH